MTKFQWRPVSAAAIAALLLASCSAGETAEQPDPGAASEEPSDGAGDDGEGASGEDGGAVSIGFTAEPASLDFTTTDGAAIPEALLVNVYEGLVKVDQSGDIVPLLAESWEVSEDGTVYDFQLQEGVTFSNGDEFSADDVKFSIERVQSDAWTIGLKENMSVVESVEVVSPTHARVTLAEPSNLWLFEMTTRIGAMFSEDAVDDLATQTVGTGPYTVDEWVRGDRIELALRDDYWGEAPAYEQVTFRYFDDASAMNNAMLSGDLDVIGNVQAPEGMDQFATDEFEIVEGTSNGEVVLAMNNASEPLDDPRVRQAIRHAIDREAVLETSWAGYGTLIGSHVSPHDPWYEDLTDVHPYDPERAQALLEEAGVSDLQLDMRIPNLPYAVNAAQVVQSYLSQVGITAEIEVLEFPARWLEEVFNGHQYDLSIISHVEPRDLVVFGRDYYWQYDNPDVTALLDEADSSDYDTFVDLMAEAARTISEDAAIDWLFSQPNLLVARADGVSGLPQNRVGEAFDVTTLQPA